MHAPAVHDFTTLFEMADMLSMSSLDDAKTIHIWVMQDYEREIWAFKCRVKLPVEDIKEQCGKFDNSFGVVTASWDGDVHVLLKLGEWLFLVDVNGKLVASFHHRGLFPTLLGLKQTLVSHTFFSTLDGYAMNASPFI
jgi:hypothetical protein